VHALQYCSIDFLRCPGGMEDEKVIFPELIVFDADMCLWSPEMYELSSLPKVPVRGDLGNKGKGVLGARNDDGDVVRLFPGALRVLQDFATGKFPKHCRIAIASSADNAMAVRCAHASMSVLEIIPGKTMRDVFNCFERDVQNLQIGRHGKLSSNKTTHFRELKKETGIAYEKMLFFDDCNWSDNCAVVARLGVSTQRTPRGLTLGDFRSGLRTYTEAERKRAASGKEQK